MSEPTLNIPVLKTKADLEQAINHYRTTDLRGEELICQWQAIRDAALAQSGNGDKIAVEDSY